MSADKNVRLSKIETLCKHHEVVPLRVLAYIYHLFFSGSPLIRKGGLFVTFVISVRKIPRKELRSYLKTSNKEASSLFCFHVLDCPYALNIII